jgi:hypothetical protein
MRTFIMQSPPIPCHLLSLRPRYLSQHPVFRTTSAYFIPSNVRNSVSHPYKSRQGYSHVCLKLCGFSWYMGWQKVLDRKIAGIHQIWPGLYIRLQLHFLNTFSIDSVFPWHANPLNSNLCPGNVFWFFHIRTNCAQNFVKDKLLPNILFLSYFYFVHLNASTNLQTFHILTLYVYPILCCDI